jgi:hypothetical protein
MGSTLSVLTSDSVASRLFDERETADLVAQSGWVIEVGSFDSGRPRRAYSSSSDEL